MKVGQKENASIQYIPLTETRTPFFAKWDFPVW